MIMWIVVALAAVLILWIVAVFNSLVSLKNQAANGWRQIDVQLKRRYDLIPNLVETVRGAMKFEQATLTQVVEARNRAMSAQGVAEKAVKESVLTGALRQLFALAESYPDLKSNQNAAKLQEELSSTENRIGFARQFYNDIATRFNIAQQVFPAALIAKIFGFTSAELFEIKANSEREVPKVDLST